MKKVKFMPGPWELKMGDTGAWYEIYPVIKGKNPMRSYLIAYAPTLAGLPEEDKEQARATAIALSVCPEMYSMLGMCLDTLNRMEYVPIIDRLTTKIEEVMAKARGEK